MQPDHVADLHLPFSRHAERRRTERCKRETTLRALFRHFDRDVYVRRGVWAWSVTQDHLDDLVDDGVISRKDAERLQNLVVLVAENGTEVVTVIRDSGRRIGRYFRRHG